MAWYNEWQLMIRCGAEDAFLELLPRALFPFAEQLLGPGTVQWPAGVTDPEAHTCTGPCFIDDAMNSKGLGLDEGSRSEPRPPPRFDCRCSKCNGNF